MISCKFINKFRGVNKEFSLSFYLLPLDSLIPFVPNDPSRFRIIAFAYNLNQYISIQGPNKIFQLANSRVVPPKYRSDYWKIITRSYKLANCELFRERICLHCKAVGIHLYRFIGCPVDVSVWNLIFLHFLEFSTKPTTANIMKIILGNFDCFPKFHPSLISVLVYCIL